MDIVSNFYVFVMVVTMSLFVCSIIKEFGAITWKKVVLMTSVISTCFIYWALNRKNAMEIRNF